jgi:imidazolonepropionase
MNSLIIYNVGSLATPESPIARERANEAIKRNGALSGAAMREVRTRNNVVLFIQGKDIAAIFDDAPQTAEADIGAFVAAKILRRNSGDETAQTAHERLDEAFNEALAAQARRSPTLNARGMTALPGFVDSHTHIVFGGNRANEFALRAAGKSYQEIAAAGGGILSTVRTTRETTREELYVMAKDRVDAALRHGSTTIEIKSGYGLDAANEIKMLEVIADLQRESEATIVPTFLGAHAFPPEHRDNRERYVEILCNEMLPAVRERGLAVFCDIFCEEGYFSLEQSERILQTALDMGFALKVHADQMSSSGASRLGVRLGAVSVDHLECSSPEDVRAIAASETIAVALPGASLFLRHPYAPARELIDAGAALALATDCNPGSSMTFSMPMMMTLACTQMRLSPEEALSASTLNGAAALGLAAERGSLECGKKADILLCNAASFYEIPYHFAYNRVRTVVKNGKVVSDDIVQKL